MNKYMRISYACRNLLLGLIFLPALVKGQTRFTIPASYRIEDEGTVIASNVPLNEINPHVFRHFRKHFLSVAEESWVKTADSYIISFTKNARRNEAHYSLRGGFLYSMKFYAGSEIGNEPGAQIRKKYPDYKIDVVTEITDGEKVFYLVTIENPASVKTLSVCDGKLEVLNDLINGGPGK